MLIDTHCHIHESAFYSDSQREAVYQRAIAAHVRMICVGTTKATSQEAIEFAKHHPETWAIIGLHPHDSSEGCDGIHQLLREHLDSSAEHAGAIVGIGEIGLDYHYMNSPRNVQIKVLEQQLQWATEYNLPVSFHVRDAFDDFWPIFSNFQGLRGVLHSYTDNLSNMEHALSKGLYVGINGISTFTKDENQQKMYDAIPLEHMLFETDAPFLTPVPHRGKINESAFVRLIAEHHALRRNKTLDEIATITSANASQLFSI